MAKLLASLHAEVGLFLFVIGLTVVMAHAHEPPERLIDRALHEGLEALREAQTKPDEKRRDALPSAMEQTFDWEAMARSCLGAAWGPLRPTHQNELTATLKQQLVRRYLAVLGHVEGSVRTAITGSVRRENQAVVKTLLITGNRHHIPVDYILRKSFLTWHIEDVTVEGVSLVDHYCKIWSRDFANHTFDDVLQRLKRGFDTALQ